MSVTRRAVLVALARLSDAESGATTTVGALADALGTGERAVAAHLDGLAACELARRDGERVRITVTGEEFLALDVDDAVVVGPFTPPYDR